MTESFQVLLSELERFGEANDSDTSERSRRMFTRMYMVPFIFSFCKVRECL
jgi:hypothetical protein